MIPLPSFKELAKWSTAISIFLLLEQFADINDTHFTTVRIRQAPQNVKAQAKDQASKMLADLFKSAILKKSKDAFDEEQNINPPAVRQQKIKIVITGAGFTRLS